MQVVKKYSQINGKNEIEKSCEKCPDKQVGFFFQYAKALHLSELIGFSQIKNIPLSYTVGNIILHSVSIAIC
jgi:hypothetical protein